MKKILNILTVVSFVMSGGLLIGITGTIFILTSESTQEKIKAKLTEEVGGLIKGQLTNSLGDSVPKLPEKTGLGISSFK